MTLFCCFPGAIALVVYYSLLHPKSTEIWQGFLETTCGAAAAGEEEEEVSGESSQAQQSSGTLGDEESLAGEGKKTEAKNETSSSLLQCKECLEDSWTDHHHWLLVKLALKTGNVSMISAAFGDGGVGEAFPGGWTMGKGPGAEPGADFSLPMRDIPPSGLAVGNGAGTKPSSGTVGVAQEGGAGQEPDLPPSTSQPSGFSPDSTESSSVYFSASAGGIASPGTGTATGMALVQRDSEAQPPPGCLGGGGGRGGGDLSHGMASISPILGSYAHKCLQRSSSLGNTGSPREGSEPTGTEAALVGCHHLWDSHPCGPQGTVVRSKLRSPCFTSTPKAGSKCPQQGLGELGEGTELSGLPG